MKKTVLKKKPMKHAASAGRSIACNGETATSLRDSGPKPRETGTPVIVTKRSRD